MSSTYRNELEAAKKKNELNQPDNLCNCKNCIEDLEHVLTECNLYNKIRTEGKQNIQRELDKAFGKPFNQPLLSDQNKYITMLGYIPIGLASKLENLKIENSKIKKILEIIHMQHLSLSYEIWKQRCIYYKNTNHSNTWYSKARLLKKNNNSTI